MANTEVKLRRGTTEENDVFTGGQGELVYDTDTKGLRIHDGSKVGGYMVDSVIAFQRPTEGNNYTWYRLYASGWVEQGGEKPKNSEQTIVLPVEMSGVNYTQNITLGDNTYSGSTPSVQSKTTTSFVISHQYVSSFKFNWQVSGMASATAIAEILGA